ncbi:MAG: hypothetical protein C4348_00095 [Patescibacteria group bacterium]
MKQQGQGQGILITDFENLLSNVFSLAFKLILFFLVGLIIWLGIKYIKGEAKEVHSRFLPLIIGILLVFLSLTIPLLIRNIFK